MRRSLLPPRFGPFRRRFRYTGRKAAFGGAAILIMLLLLLADRAGVFGRGKSGDWETYQARQFKVVHVVDGDTLDIDVPDGRHDSTRIRMLGLDTPETVHPNKPVQYFGKEASDYLKGVAAGKTVTVQLDRVRMRDDYGRLLAYVLLDGANLNERMIAEGYGYADPRFPHPLKSRFHARMIEARKAGRGLWAGVKEEELPYYLQRQPAERP